MNTIKYLTPIYTFLLICIIPNSALLAQDWNYQIGLNAANFRFQSPAGITQNTFQPDAGLQLSILRNDRMMDSAKTKSVFLRKLNYQVGMAINQFNSFGETQNIPYTYSSTYVGLRLGFGMKSTIGKGVSLSYNGIMQLNQLVLGSQKMGNQVYNLQGNKQFDRIQWLLGGEMKLVKQMNNHTAIFAYFSEAWQLNTIQKDGSLFAINPVSFGFGIQYFTLR